MRETLKEKFSLLAWRGKAASQPDAPKIAISQEAYTALMELARSRKPAEAFGALLGSVQPSEAGELTRLTASVRVENIVSTRLQRAGMDVTPDVDEWAGLQEELENGSGKPGAGDEGPALSSGTNSIVGWFYSDPGINIFPPRLDIPEAGKALAPYTNLLLLVNPSTNEGGFYTLASGSFVSVGGFYEAVPEPDSAPIISWNGHVEGAARWLEIGDEPAASTLSNATTTVAASIAPYSESLVTDTQPIVSVTPLEDGNHTPAPDSPHASQAPPLRAPDETTAETVHELPWLTPDVADPHAQIHEGSRAAPTVVLSGSPTESPKLEKVQPDASNVLDTHPDATNTRDAEVEAEEEPETTWMPQAPLPRPHLEKVVTASVSLPTPALAPDFADTRPKPKPVKQVRGVSARRFILPALFGLLVLAVASGLMLRGGLGGSSPAPTPTLTPTPAGGMAALLPTSDASSPSPPTQEVARPTERPRTPTSQPLPSATAAPTQVVAVVGESNKITMQDSAFQGGYVYPDYLYRDRSAHLLYGRGADARYSSMTGAFNLNLAQISTRGPVAFTLVGLDSEDAAKTPIRISLNGTVIYEGPDPLPNSAKIVNWGSHSWDVKLSLFKQGTNSVTVENLDRTHKVGDPVFLALDYVEVSWDNAR